MTRAEIPAAVLDFLVKRIDSVPELETLLIMSADEQRAWAVPDIAGLTYVPQKSALAVLRALERHGLVSGNAQGSLFRFSPKNDEERQVVIQTEVAYRNHLVSIATFIHRKAATPVQEFARAFNLKKED